VAVKRPRVGQLRHRVIVRRNRKISDGRGGYNTLPEDVIASYPVRIEELSGRELAEFQTRSTKITTLIQGRFHPDITEACWIEHGEKTYEIEQAIDWEERHVWLDILAVQRR